MDGAVVVHVSQLGALSTWRAHGERARGTSALNVCSDGGACEAARLLYGGAHARLFDPEDMRRRQPVARDHRGEAAVRARVREHHVARGDLGRSRRDLGEIRVDRRDEVRSGAGCEVVVDVLVGPAVGGAECGLYRLVLV